MQQVVCSKIPNNKNTPSHTGVVVAQLSSKDSRGSHKVPVSISILGSVGYKETVLSTMHENAMSSFGRSLTLVATQYRCIYAPKNLHVYSIFPIFWQVQLSFPLINKNITKEIFFFSIY